MTEVEQIGNALHLFVDKQIDNATLQGVVTDISKAESEATISVNIGTTAEPLVLDDIRLRSIIDNTNGFIIIPKVDSQVLLLRLTTSVDFFVVACAEVEKVIFKGSSVQMELNKDFIIFNNNALSGFIPDITKLVTKLNNLETLVNTIISSYNAHTHLIPVYTAPVATPAPTPPTMSLVTQTLTATTIADIKDPKIKN